MTNIPEELKELEGIEKYHLSFPHYIYFLYDKKELVYIGKTAGQLTSRLIKHQEDKQFTDCYILKFSNNRICSIKEMEFISKFKPKYNKHGIDCFFDMNHESIPLIDKLIKHHGSTEVVAKLLGITIRHLENCQKGNHIGKPLEKLIRSYSVQFER